MQTTIAADRMFKRVIEIWCHAAVMRRQIGRHGAVIIVR
jgi:hypothetical protein